MEFAAATLLMALAGNSVRRASTTCGFPTAIRTHPQTDCYLGSDSLTRSTACLPTISTATTSRDSVECKLFGLGSESYVVGSHEFYLSYAISRQKLLCLDAGHFHPTEVISDKISSVLTFLDEILLHVSRGVRWDSDHVVTFTDELQSIAREIVRGDFLNRVHLGLDFFDASINRIAAWVIGTRNTQKALLAALLEPTQLLCEAELEMNYTKRLALMEQLKTFPLGTIWNQFCLEMNCPSDHEWLESIRCYEQDTLYPRES